MTVCSFSSCAHVCSYVVFTVLFFAMKAVTQLIMYPHSFIYIQSRITAIGANSDKLRCDEQHDEQHVESEDVPYRRLWQHAMCAESKPFSADNNVMLVALFNVDPARIPHLHQKVTMTS